MRKLIFITALLMSQPAFATSFDYWQTFKATRLLRDAPSGAYCYVTGHSRVDADGAPNAYHPDDAAHPAPPHRGLDDPRNAGYPGTSWWSSVLARDPAHLSRPFVRTTGPFAGYFVSKTWLAGPGAETDPAKYVDSTKVPYIVMPGSAFARLAGTGTRGDVGIAWNLTNGRSTAFVIADQGGGSDARLGEGSIALFEALGGSNINARNGSGVAPGNVRFVVFPRSRLQMPWPTSNARIDQHARALLTGIGGEATLAGCAP